MHIERESQESDVQPAVDHYVDCQVDSVAFITYPKQDPQS